MKAFGMDKVLKMFKKLENFPDTAAKEIEARFNETLDEK